MSENQDSIEIKAEELPHAGPNSGYRVLARKYRPHSFSGLIGQKVLVRILKSAFESERIAHAFILSGTRGIGKTTTARIIARALNCVGSDGTGGVTIEPCGSCVHCQAISEDRHLDTLEVDAASRTGVDDMREIIESVRYLPTSSRYKVYIIDEVHMLSKNAFNALLKTLEEPPPHVKFIFATTEIKKVPITVLSRCQRFDLSRVDAKELTLHFSEIIAKEEAEVSDSAIKFIARAADGSVRDGLSILDQAICQNSVVVDEDFVREMLGFADRSQTFDLLKLIFSGDIRGVLELFDAQYRGGANPQAICEDMLEIVSLLTRIKITPDIVEDISISEIERKTGKEMVEKISMAFLARAWQILLKGLAEINIAPSAKQAADMVLIRLAYSSDLPTPDEAIRLYRDTLAPNGSVDGSHSLQPTEKQESSGLQKKANPEFSTNLKNTNRAVPSRHSKYNIPESVQEVLALVEEKGGSLLRTHLMTDVNVTSFKVGRIEFDPLPCVPKDFAKELAGFLNNNTSVDWEVIPALEGVLKNMPEENGSEKELTDIEEMPLVRSALEVFPDITIEKDNP